MKDKIKKIGYLSQNPNDYLFNDSVYEELMFTAKKKNVAEYWKYTFEKNYNAYKHNFF